MYPRFYYFIRNSLVLLMEPLFARVLWLALSVLACTSFWPTVYFHSLCHRSIFTHSSLRSLVSPTSDFTYTHLRETLCFFQVVHSHLSRSRRVDWDYVNRSVSLKRSRLKLRRRASSCVKWAGKLLSCRRRHMRHLSWLGFMKENAPQARFSLVKMRRRHEFSVLAHIQMHIR